MDRSIETVTEMITQRGYKITENTTEHIIGSNLNAERIIAFKNNIIKFNIDKVKELISVLFNIKINRCIVIYDDITTATKKLINSLTEQDIELFTHEELQYNITKHRLVPEHIRLDTKDAIDFKKKFGLKHATILRSEPISRFYNYNRGDIIKIIRVHDNIEYIAHRIVKG